MGFLQKAFIRKNTPELRAKLEDIGLLDVEFKIDKVIISFENIETEEKFYRNIPIDEFLNYLKNDKDTIKQ